MVSVELSRASTDTLIDVTLASSNDDAVDSTAQLLHHKAESISSEHLRRLQVEWRFCRETGYAGAILELVRLGQGIQGLGHTLHVDGAAAGSTLMYAAGLTPLDPVEHGLLTERFLDVGRQEGNYWPWGQTGISTPDIFGARTSLGPQELMLVLRRQGYALSTSATTWPGNTDCILAEPRSGCGARAVHLLVSESSTAVLANMLTPWEREASTNDIQTWHLLAAGDTAGIEILDSAVIQDALARTRPRSLVELAGVLALTRLGSLAPGLADGDGSPVYQEDLMQILHDSLGIGLREAYALVRAVGPPLSVNGDRVRDAFFAVKRAAPLSPREWNQLWDRIVVEGPIAVCKAAYLTTAHDCLRAAYLKAHQPAVLRAVVRRRG